MSKFWCWVGKLCDQRPNFLQWVGLGRRGIIEELYEWEELRRVVDMDRIAHRQRCELVGLGMDH